MKKSFFALLLAAVLPAANAASATERDVQSSALAAKQARLESAQAQMETELARLAADLARIEAFIAAQEARSGMGENERIAALEARISKLEKRLAKSNSYNPNRVYVCSVKPFQKLFEASGKNEWEARRAVRTACNAETSAMFCEDSAIRCEKYD